MDSRRLNRIVDRIEDYFAAFAALLIISAMLAVSLDVILRFFFMIVIKGLSEMTEFALLFIPMAGAAWLLRMDGHVRIDVIINYLSPKYSYFVSGMTSAVGTIICAVFTYIGALTTWDYFQRNVETVGVIPIPRWIIQIIIPVGFFLLSVEAFRKMFSFFRMWRELRFSESPKK